MHVHIHVSLKRTRKLNVVTLGEYFVAAKVQMSLDAF